ncbi:MAG: alkaline phosphatase family protein [Thermoanaerobaculales bacterium]|jgi:hypothetical protein|nr:alkaline phosphatase family protein [Thermoanaerobaculales bacterium]
MKRDLHWIHGLTAGAAAGVLAGVLVMRLNPEVGQPLGGVAVGVVLWASWGALIVGLPLALMQVLVRRVRGRRETWPAPGLMAAMYFLAGVLSAVNADLYLHLLSATAKRVVQQDAVAWFLGAVLALLVGGVIRRRDGGTVWKVAFATMMILLPAGRLVVRPTTAAQPLAVRVEAIGSPERPLVVIGVEGLDVPVLLTHSGSGRTPALERFMAAGAWGSVRPYEPFLRQSYWTTVATGAEPGAHGVKAHRGWKPPWLDETLRLMPWTPQGSRLILPWGLPQQVQPPPATVPALWERMRLSQVETTVVAWPGFWPPQSGVRIDDEDSPRVAIEDGLREALEVALGAFRHRAPEVWSAIRRDQHRLGEAVVSLTAGEPNVWVHLEALAVTRQLLEPLKPRHTGEREVVELVVELLDGQLEALLSSAPPDALVVLVSPYGLSPPSSYERIRRLVGIGDDWHTSGDRCWDGVLMVMGRDVVPGRVFDDVRLTDVVPSSCYLLGLPLAQYMAGEVIIEAVDSRYLATHPLVVD